MRDFLQGSVWVSTLEACRKYEEKDRGDPGDGTMWTQHPDAYGDGDTDAVVESLNLIGVSVPRDAKRVTVQDLSELNHIPDAWLFCMSAEYNPSTMKSFGRYCVGIRDPQQLYDRLTDSIHTLTPLKQRARGPVTYADRSHLASEPSPGVIGFVKPRDLYGEQREWRMMFIPTAPEKLKPQVFSVGDLTGVAYRAR